MRRAALALPALGLAFAAGAARADCEAAGWEQAAAINAVGVSTLSWSPFGRAEAGWEPYLPMVARDLSADCPPDTPAFAAAFARFQAREGLPAWGLVNASHLMVLKSGWQARRPFVAALAKGECPETAEVIAEARSGEALDGKTAWAHPAALRAWKAMAAAARAEVPEIGADPNALRLFSGYRSPALDAARCAADGNCDGVARARCSAHRTGLALDLFVGFADGYSADSTAPANRLAQTRTPGYRWLVKNAGRFGFVNYAYEPWHWEWTGTVR